MKHDFLMGAVAMGLSTASLFLLRYWKETRDRLFAFFALAFLVLSANRLLLVLLREQQEHSVWPYLIRLVAFLLILAAIIDKNLRRN